MLVRATDQEKLYKKLQAFLTQMLRSEVVLSNIPLTFFTAQRSIRSSLPTVMLQSLRQRQEEGSIKDGYFLVL